MTDCISKSQSSYCRNFGEKLAYDKFAGLPGAAPGALF